MKRSIGWLLALLALVCQGGCTRLQPLRPPVGEALSSVERLQLCRELEAAAETPASLRVLGRLRVQVGGSRDEPRGGAYRPADP